MINTDRGRIQNLTMGFVLVSTAVTAWSARRILKYNEVLEGDRDKAYEAGRRVASLVIYQHALIQKHMPRLDEFDQVVFDTLQRDIQEALEALGMEFPEPIEEDES